MRILLAEDERITRTTLVRQLERWGHTVVAAEDGAQAWERYRAGVFDMVLTDWEMPHISGVELIQRIRAAAEGNAGERRGEDVAYVYILMLTGRSDKSDVVRGMEAGADDFVCKPFDREELRVRVLAGVRIVQLEQALQRQNAELREASERIHHGLRAAARVQRATLPRGNIVAPGVRTAWKYVPSEELAGDAIGLHLLEERYLVAYVIDVSGHGVPAALLSVSAMHAMEPMNGPASLLRRETAESGGELGSLQRPANVATEMNRRFRSGDHDGRYLTMILAILDTRSGRLYFTSAGHPFPIIVRGAEVVPVAETAGFPVAIVDEAEYRDTVVDLRPGDRVCLYSDGVTEQMKGSEQFGEARLVSMLREGESIPPEPLVTRIIETLSGWAGESTFTDDVSIVMLEWTGP